MANFYKKLYTKVKETLEDDFPDPNPKLLSNDGLNNIGIKFIDTLKTPNGLKFKTTLKRDPNGNLTGTLEPEIKFSSKNITFEGKISTDNKYEDSVSFTNYLVDGSKFSLKGLYEEGSMNGEAGLEFKNENVAFNASLSYPDSGDIKVAAAAVYNSSGYSLGGDAEYVMSSALNKWSIKVQRDTEENSFCFFSNHVLVPKKKKESPKSDIGFGYAQDVRSGLKGGLDFKIDSNLDSDLRFGSNYEIDETSNLKTRLSLKKKEELRLGLVYKQKLSSTSKLALSADLNTRHLFGNEGTNDHRFWVTLTCGDD